MWSPGRRHEVSSWRIRAGILCRAREVVSACGQAGAERAQSVEVVDVGRLGCGSGNGDVWEAGFEVLRQVSLLADALHAFRVHPQDPFGQSVLGEVGQVLTLTPPPPGSGGRYTTIQNRRSDQRRNCSSRFSRPSWDCTATGQKPRSRSRSLQRTRANDWACMRVVIETMSREQISVDGCLPR